ncbi:MAG TPA: chloride channel protein, partial [Ktedonobacterales bacterium]|nr:chloride channel protein [Ktedonobacterales bacterium]
YLILGICAGGIGLLYPKTLYGVRDLFHKIHIPNHFKPAIGGLLVGLIGLVIPQALGIGYGYVQFGINNDYLHVAAWLMAVLIFVKILATSLTIGSGGSGGVFGPGMVIGGFLGGALWAGLHTVAPGLVAGTNAGAFVVVGMGAFFGGIAKAPLAVILMVAEMTGEFALIAPAMLATMVAYFITGDTSIYENQVPTRLDSPAHKDDFALPLLQSVSVRDAMVAGVSGALATATPDTSVEEISRLMRDSRVRGVPIIRDNRLVGVVTPTDLARVAASDPQAMLARQVMSRDVARAYPDDSLYTAWLRMSRRGLRQIAVVSRDDPFQLQGMVTADGISKLLRLSTRQAAALTPPTVPASADRVSVSSVATTQSPESDEAEQAPEADMISDMTSGDDGDPLAHMRVAEAMLATPRLVRDTDPVELARGMLEERGNALMVVNAEGGLVGIVTRSDLRARPSGASERGLTLGDVAVRNVVTARPNETLRAAARRMSRLSLRQLPVVADDSTDCPPLGLLRRSDILAAYEHSLEEPAPIRG